MSADLTAKRIAILATDGDEAAELTSPWKALEQAGATVQVLAPRDGTIRLRDHAEKSGTLMGDREASTVRRFLSPRARRRRTGCWA
jgi:protease I